MFALQAMLVFALAAVLGVGSAWWAVDREVAVEQLQVGGWTAWPTAGEPGADPYVRALFARTGELPMNIAEGLSFAARRDSEGMLLRADCQYRVAGAVPAAGWWTLSVYRDETHTLIDNPAERYGFASAEALREPDGTVEIVVAPRARPGNWIPVDPEAGNLRLVFRLYETPLSVGGAIDAIEMPEIEREGCL